MKKTKMEKGITLIALIITIIILLILAIVTINAIQGDEGLITKANNAATKYKESAEKENALIHSYLAKMPGEDAGINSNEGGATSLVTMYNNGELEIGDYVAYTPNASSSYTAVSTRTGAHNNRTIDAQTFTWRVMGLDNSGNLLLVSSAPTTSEIEFLGHVGYNNYEEVLNELCNTLYGNTDFGITARSMTLADVEKTLGNTTVQKAKKQFNTYYSSYTHINDGETYTSNYTNTFNGIYIPTNWVNTNNNITLESTGYAGILTTEIEDTITSEDVREIIFGPTSNEYTYFLSTRSVLVTASTAGWGFNFVSTAGSGKLYGIDILSSACSSNGNEFTSNSSDTRREYDEGYILSFRPVIVIPESITTSDFAVSKTGTLTEWDF